MENVRELILDASHWKTKDDIYNSFFKAVGAPVWHGRNFDALRDSIVTGSINEIELPYRIVIENFSKVSPGAFESAMNFAELIKEFEVEGYPIEIDLR